MPEVQVAGKIPVAVVERTPSVLLRVRPVVVVYRDYLDRVRRAAVEYNRPYVVCADLVAPYVCGVCAFPFRGICAVFRRGIDARLRAFPVCRVSDALRRAESAAVHAAALEENERTRRKILLLEPTPWRTSFRPPCRRPSRKDSGIPRLRARTCLPSRVFPRSASRTPSLSTRETHREGRTFRLLRIPAPVHAQVPLQRHTPPVQERRKTKSQSFSCLILYQKTRGRNEMTCQL